MEYRQNVFIPAMTALIPSMRRWIEDIEWGVPPEVKHVTVIWFHNESTYYAHDCCQNTWVSPDSSPTPRTKGEGQSLIIADFVLVDYGWLQSPDGKETACIVFKAGKNREGYFLTKDVIAQFKSAATIVKQCYPEEDHVFVYDNATTHTA